MITYGRHHPEIRLTIPPCRKPIRQCDSGGGVTWRAIATDIAVGSGAATGVSESVFDRAGTGRAWCWWRLGIRW